MRILIAEDEKELSNALMTILKHNNYSVDVVDNGEDAIDYIGTQNYDAVILDIMMPKIDGITVLKTVRKNLNKIPILLLTAKTEIDDRVVGLDAGADDYLAKPFSTKELLARIRAITRRRSDATDSILQLGNIKLNRYTYELTSSNGMYKLASKEYQMMEMLMNNSGNMISTERFMERIWGYDTEVEINIVWVYISYLRKKLTVINSNVEIKALRGVGYFLRVIK